MSVRDDPSSLPSRRGAVLAASLALGSSLLLSGCGRSGGGQSVGAVEGLMRNHGVLRRVLAVYRRSALALRINPAVVDSGALADAADLFHGFGEDYHERALEEQFVFPRLTKAGGANAALVGVLVQQHERGRVITAFIHARCAGGRVGAADAEPTARAMESMADMYEAHAAFEDTIVFPAWTKLLSGPELSEMGERFAGVQKSRFKSDGFDMAQARIGGIEQRLGLHDLSLYTAPPPPDAPTASGAAASPEAPD